MKSSSPEQRHEWILENGKIKTVSLTTEDHGILTAWLHVEFRSSGCGFGGFVLGREDGGNLDGSANYAAEFIVRCLKVVGVMNWEDLSGCPIRCLHEGLGGGIVAIGNFLDDEWFSPKIEWKKTERKKVEQDKE